jgi:hypothetical protein
MLVRKHNFKVGDLLINRTAYILFSCDFDSLYYGILFVDISKGEVVVVVEIIDNFITIQTESGKIGWQSAIHFELLEKK